MMETTKIILEENQVSDPLKFPLSPGQWIERENGTDLKSGFGSFILTTHKTKRKRNESKRAV